MTVAEPEENGQQTVVKLMGVSYCHFRKHNYWARQTIQEDISFALKKARKAPKQKKPTKQ